MINIIHIWHSKNIKITISILMFLTFGFYSAKSQNHNFDVSIKSYNSSDFKIDNEGYIYLNVPLKNNAIPQVKVINTLAEKLTTTPQTNISNAYDPDVFKGVERKNAIAVIKIPAYKKSNNGVEKLVSFDLQITELKQPKTAAKPNFKDNSILATGNWYKISVIERGIYKIDYNFLQSIGVNPATINPNNIRLYGNGGTVLSEKVSDDAPDDLIENAIFVSTSGSSFGTNDYILFYANGPTLWQEDEEHEQLFKHTTNWYEDKSFYFLNFDIGTGKRIENINATGTANVEVTSFNDYRLIDKDSVSPTAIGKPWWGSRMTTLNQSSLTQNFNFTLGNPIGNVYAKIVVGHDGNSNANIRLAANNQTFRIATFNGVYDYLPIQALDLFDSFSTGNNLTISTTYVPGGSGNAYVDYIQLNYKNQLSFQNGQFTFRDRAIAYLGFSTTAAYKIQNANSNLKVWDVTNALNPIALNGNLSGNIYTVVRPCDTLREFVAFDGTVYRSPIFEGVVANQNLHALPQTELLIITADTLLAAAEELANFHRQREQVHVTVVTVDKIYNEFSSGSQDISGIRNFIRMFYERANNDNEIPKGVTFFGAASYDYKNRLANNTNLVPAFQSLEGRYTPQSYCTDDFYALLDAGEDINNSVGTIGMYDIAIGRIPARNLLEAYNVINKLKEYTSPSSFGPWKNNVSFVADNRDPNGGMNHLNDCETINQHFDQENQIFNVYKIYADAYNKVLTPSGIRMPLVNKAINDRIFNGTLMKSYNGHGSPTRWADEAILTLEDYSSWTNVHKLPLIFTGTCDFGRFDDPNAQSAGNKLMLQAQGGAIALVTTTQVVYSTPNVRFAERFVENQFVPDANGKYLSMGESVRRAKNNFQTNGEYFNNKMFVLLGDPFLKLSIPENNINTTGLYMLQDGEELPTDTIKALGKYTIEGEVTDYFGTPLTDFNGIVYITIYDKPRLINTIPDERNPTPFFKTQTNTIARIVATVNDGVFSASFVAPKDIMYDFGIGKVSYYAHSDKIEAKGLDTNLVVGGINPNAEYDNFGPIVQPYIDDEKFRDGGITGPNPMLYVRLSDDNGINVSGNSVGHDLVAILDDDVQNQFILNDYYQTEQNDYSKGYVYFPLYNLPEGKHTIRVKAWDAHNNSGEGTVTFEVRGKGSGVIGDLYNYPNPFFDKTTFVIQHNQEGEGIELDINIYTTSGALVRTIKNKLTATGNRTEVQWDGTGNNGSVLTKGMYIYKVHLKTAKGITATAHQKLVLMR